MRLIVRKKRDRILKNMSDNVIVFKPRDATVSYINALDKTIARFMSSPYMVNSVFGTTWR